MAMFTLHRNYRFISDTGHSIYFEKGVPTHVPPVLHRAVQAFGAIPVEGDVESILGDEATKKQEVPMEERNRQLIDAFKKLQEHNGRGDFTGQGIPSVTALKKIIIDFDPDKKEVEALWQLYIEDQNAV